MYLRFIAIYRCRNNAYTRGGRAAQRITLPIYRTRDFFRVCLCTYDGFRLPILKVFSRIV